MHNKHFINAQQVTFLTTNTCTAKCDHCSVFSSPERKGTLTASQMIKTINELNAITPLIAVIFAGGEPTLLGRDLLETIAHAESLGIMTRMVTNAHWATTERTAKMKLVELREAGLREINISCDDYHTPFIPLIRIRNAWKASKSVGFDSVVIASASGPESELTPARIRVLLEEDVPDYYDEDGIHHGELPVSDGSVRLISNAKIARLGRGVKTVPIKFLRFPQSQKMLDMPCPWIGRSPAVGPNNHLLSCCGMEASGKLHLDYGPLEDGGVESRLNHAQSDTIVAALHVLGPYKLMQFLKSVAPELEFWDRYSGLCELCAHIFARPEVASVLSKHESTISMLVALAQSESDKVDLATPELAFQE